MKTLLQQVADPRQTLVLRESHAPMADATVDLAEHSLTASHIDVPAVELRITPLATVRVGVRTARHGEVCEWKLLWSSQMVNGVVVTLTSERVPDWTTHSA